MARLGRDLELFVANLQKFLLGSGFEVKCPEYLIAREQEGAQELDITVRGRVDGRDVLMILACRDRAKPQGREWVREVSAARAEFAATDVIAVSSSGFTKPARALAQRLRVELRSVRELDETEAQRLTWIAAGATYTSWSLDVRLVAVSEVRFDTPSHPDPDGALAAVRNVMAQHQNWREQMFVRTLDGKPAGLKDAIDTLRRELIQELMSADQPGPERLFALDGQTKRVRLSFSNPLDRFAVVTPLGLVHVNLVVMTLAFSVPRRESQRRATRTLDTGDAIQLAESVTFDVELPDGKPGLLDLHRRPAPDGEAWELGVVLRPKAPPPRSDPPAGRGRTSFAR